ncbi:Ger(x)C family spore germination protein [Paenibacillus silvisoli]|uniref:Ger(x)C family spore germination protein n=1 Tax=Paenibacillus silvisoli TaxID=3110539 RepID=UPI002804B68F|nr:Ger(x)C family spore germination protein [Paenibacillus silvisoli]
MKKAAIVLLSLLLLTGCWDRLPLRDLHLVNYAGIDLDEKSGDILVNFVVSNLGKSGQGGGELSSKVTALKGKSVSEAFEQGSYIDRGPFYGIDTGIYFLSEKFALNDPVGQLDFLLHTRYSAINCPVIVIEGSLSKFLNDTSINAHELFAFISHLGTNKIVNNVALVHFLLSEEEPLEDIVLPMIKQEGSRVMLKGALLFQQGKSTGAKLNKKQVRMLMLLSGTSLGMHRLTTKLTESIEGRQPHTGQLNGIDYAFSTKKVISKISVQPEPGELPNVRLKVRMKIIIFELGKGVHPIKSDYANKMEKELEKHLEEEAAATIEKLQKANCDALGIGKQIRAYHPNIWKSLKWRNDYPRLSIQPVFDVQIINANE